jgi:hypothetical protein
VTVPANVTQIVAEVWGAGGGGSGSCFSQFASSWVSGLGGGQGAYERVLITVNPGDILQIRV